MWVNVDPRGGLWGLPVWGPHLGSPSRVPVWVGVRPEGGDGFVPRFLDEEDIRVISLEDHMDASVAPLCIDGSYFDLIYCHILGIHPCGGLDGDRVSE